MATETWIVYKTEEMNYPGWEERMLMPRESLTDILEENWSAQENPSIPERGQRTRAYKSESEDGSITHASQGDWVVTRVERFASFDTDMRIVLCYCKYEPVEPEWQEIPPMVPAKDLSPV